MCAGRLLCSDGRFPTARIAVLTAHTYLYISVMKS